MSVRKGLAQWQQLRLGLGRRRGSGGGAAGTAGAMLREDG